MITHGFSLIFTLIISVFCGPVIYRPPESANLVANTIKTPVHDVTSSQYVELGMNSIINDAEEFPYIYPALDRCELGERQPAGLYL